MTTPRIVEIIPGKSIGDVHLGMHRNSLPKGTLLEAFRGRVAEVRFLMNDADEVSDVWIEDLRVFPNLVFCAGKEVPHDIPIEALGETFGGCDRVPGLKGGIFFNCANGLSIGTDFSRRALRIGVKRILAENGGL